MVCEQRVTCSWQPQGGSSAPGKMLRASFPGKEGPRLPGRETPILAPGGRGGLAWSWPLLAVLGRTLSPSGPQLPVHEGAWGCLESPASSTALRSGGSRPCPIRLPPAHGPPAAEGTTSPTCPRDLCASPQGHPLPACTTNLGDGRETRLPPDASGASVRMLPGRSELIEAKRSLLGSCRGEQSAPGQVPLGVGPVRGTAFMTTIGGPEVREREGDSPTL